ncbi:MAG: hypothetical protein COV31_00975 [Candidatus Yanofskybacteria bacterium CG10_big_fil_rev_8_21_14_0_10_46_23]|uniref:Rod shape-determining protein MreD n=1 Tax=Candidatus Yanofskybacteria bacterium CG10_big_fil_rev_8_21_14_0_10_46_23 TaxID=1975098 RepID=A0A2H0R4N2_9BACT|nr:MAG: hypothetical protein COV31_00975 [Candidatus Yanofskybacteria bacterium CG10_big_fil_rev_8_21_14_0_10_46_23]
MKYLFGIIFGLFYDFVLSAGFGLPSVNILPIVLVLLLISSGRLNRQRLFFVGLGVLVYDAFQPHHFGLVAFAFALSLGLVTLIKERLIRFEARPLSILSFGLIIGAIQFMALSALVRIWPV